MLRSEDLFTGPDAVYARVQQFLGLDPLPVPTAAVPENVGRARAQVSDELKQHLSRYYAEPNRRLQQLLPDFPLWPEAD